MSWNSLSITLSAGDVLTLSYSKDSSQSSGSDVAKFSFTCPEIMISQRVEKPAEACVATCDHSVICSYCDQMIQPAFGHSYDIWDLIVVPTETSDGFRMRTCSTCSHDDFELVYFATGDADGDGVLTNSDITLAIRALSGWQIETSMRFDFNYDRKITNREVIEFIRRLVLAE